MALMYLATGVTLVVAMAVVLFYYFSPKRKHEVEAAKYDMLDDEPPMEMNQDTD